MKETLEHQIRLLEDHLSHQPQSPRFAELASYYLEAGRTQDALALCDKGLAQYPFYSTAHLVRGKILLALNLRAEARREFEFVHSTIPNSEAVLHYLKQVPPSEDEQLVGGIASTTTGTMEEAAGFPVTPVEAETPIQTEAETEAEQQLAQFTEAVVEEPPAAEPGLPPQVPEETVQPEAAVEAPAEDVFGITTQPAEQDVFQPAEPVEEPLAAGVPAEISPPGESFEEYAQRKRMELIGSEDMMSLDEYLAGPSEPTATTEPPSTSDFSEPVAPEPTPEDPFAQLTALADGLSGSAPADLPQREPETTDPFAALQLDATEPAAAPEVPEQQDQIDELAKKLKDAKRITPVINLSEKSISATPSDELESPAGTGFVTPTLAEIYAKQGWYDDAIKAYRALAASKPAEREKYEARIQELEELKKQQESQ